MLKFYTQTSIDGNRGNKVTNMMDKMGYNLYLRKKIKRKYKEERNKDNMIMVAPKSQRASEVCTSKRSEISLYVDTFVDTHTVIESGGGT